MSFANLPNMFTQLIYSPSTEESSLLFNMNGRIETSRTKGDGSVAPIKLEQSMTNQVFEICPDYEDEERKETREREEGISITAPPSLSASRTNSASSLSLDALDEDETASLMDDTSIPLISLLLQVTGVQEEVIFKQNGYEKIKKITNTLQGELILAKNMKTNDFVMIKKCDKDLVSGNVSFADDEDMHFCVEDNVFKEKKILQYLTIDNYPTSDYIIKYIDFFQSDTNYYLVTQSISSDHNKTLKDFIDECHKYIKNGKLKRKQFEKIVKYLFWQLSATMYWLHNDMHCCHLHLSMETILVENCGFIANGDGELVVNPAIIIKLTDFSKSEVFKAEDFNFKCMNFANNMTTENVQYLCPNLYNERIYDARKADMWCLGMILFHCIAGKPIYSEIDFEEVNEPIVGTGYWAVSTSQIKTYLATNNIIANSKMVSIIVSLLEIDETKRINSIILLRHSWFKSYFKKYQQRIQKKSIKQAQQLQEQKGKLSSFPFYSCPCY